MIWALAAVAVVAAVVGLAILFIKGLANIRENR